MAIRRVYFDTDVCKSAGSSYSYTNYTFGSGEYACGSATMYVDAYIDFDDTGSSNPILYLEAYMIGNNIRSYNNHDQAVANFLPIKYNVYFYNNATASGSPVYTYTYADPYITTMTPSTWKTNQTFSFNTSRSGTYGVPSQVGNMTSGGNRTNCFGGSLGYKAITLPFSGTPFSFQFSVEYAPYHQHQVFLYAYESGQHYFSGYVPGRVSVTAPSHVYVNGVNTFSASIGSDVTSDITMRLTGNAISSGTGVTFGGLDQPVRNQNPPYITYGTQTNYIYWNGNLFGDRNYNNFVYTMSILLTVTDPSNSAFKTLVTFIEKSGSADYRSENDLSAYTTSVSIVDTAGYFDQFHCMLRNTDSIIRATASMTLQYGASAKIRIRKFGDSSYITLADLAQAYNLTYDQYVPQTGDFGETVCDITAGGFVLATATFSASIEDYAAPTFTNIAVHRCDADGTSNDNGDHVRIEWGIIVAPISNQNTKLLTIDHPEGKTVYSNLGYIDNGELVVAADPDYSYEIVLTLADSIHSGTNATVRNVALSTAGVIMDWLYGGKGVAFGKVAELENALEVGSDWNLIAYKMMLNDVNVVNWIKEIASRMNAIEQFASNIGSTSQFQVTFYNDGELLERQWVLSGYDATAPDEEPTRESSPTQSFSFVGWALTNGATTADPNALLNIRSYRSIYAAFTAATRYYYVAFFNESSLITSFSQIQYQASPSYSDYSGLSPTPPQGASFVGYMPSGRFVESNVKAMAQFYYDQEITDSWAEIVAACADGTYKDKYKPGNWKMLDLGSEGNIKMRIKGLNMHRMIGQNKAPITWEADNKLATNKAMNSTVASKVYGDETEDGFTYAGITPEYFYSRYAHCYNINELADSNENKAVMTVTVTNTSSSAFNIRPGFYRPSASSGHVKMTSPIFADPLEKDLVSGEVDISSWGIELEAGGSFTYTVEMYGTNFSGGPLQFIVFEYSNPNNYSPRLSTSADIEQVRKPAGYEGGAVGGFGKSDLHKYLQETIKPLFPEELRLGLKKMRLIQKSLKSKGESPFYEFVDNDWLETDLFIPSSEEIVGNNAGNTKGVDFDMFAPAYRRKGNTSSSNFYWCRDVYDVPTSTITEKLSYFSAITGYTDSLLVVKQHYVRADYAKPVYICFCT